MLAGCCHRRIRIARDAARKYAVRTGFFQGSDDVGRGARGRNAYDGIVFGNAVFFEFYPSVLRVVLGILHGVAQGCVATGNQSVHHRGRNTKGWRQLRSVEYAQTAACSGTHIEYPSAAFHTGDDFFNKSFYLWYGFFYGEGYLFIFRVNINEELMHRFLFEVIVERALF